MLSVVTSSLIPNSLTSMADSEGHGAKMVELVNTMSTSPGRSSDCSNKSPSAPLSVTCISRRRAAYESSGSASESQMGPCRT